MTSKAEWKSLAQKRRKRVRRMRKIIKTGLKTISERDKKIAQLTSVIEQDHHKKK